MKIFLGGGGARWERVNQFLKGGEVSGFLEIVITNFTSQVLFGLLFTCRLKDHMFIFTYLFKLFYLKKFNSVY